MTCMVCGNSEGNATHRVREMMFGSGEEFAYQECAECGCLQLLDVPSDMARHYPGEYYSFEGPSSVNPVRRLLRARRDGYALFGEGILGKLLCMRYPTDVFDALGRTGIRRGAAVLDIGCGSGTLLRFLRDMGMSRLVGVDPFTRDEVRSAGLEILKESVLDLPDGARFDVIVANHSLEHIPDQLQTMSKVHTLLADHGVCLVRMPVKSQPIWDRYGINWVQIDAPRHYCIHTVPSFEVVAGRAGLSIDEIVFDSNDFQFWASEQYERGISLSADNSYAVNPNNSSFSARQIAEYKRIAKQLNADGQGDQAAFYLRKRAG